MKKILLSILFMFLTVPCFADVYYIGQWEWCQDETIEYWCSPQKDFLTGVVDLRNLGDQGDLGTNVGDVSNGWAIFSYSQAVSSTNLFNLSDNLDKKLNNPTKNKINNELGITLQSDNVRDAVYEILTLHGDPTGLSKWKPLLPDVEGKLKVRLGTDGIIKEVRLIPFVSPEWKLVQKTVQENYRQLLKHEDYTTIAMWLDFQEEKYGVSYEEFIPDDAIIRLASIPHQTTITEDFNCSDSDNLDCDLDWTELTGDADIVSNEYEAITNSNRTFQRVEDALSSDDHYSQATITALPHTTNTSEMQFTCRKADVNNFYVMNVSQDGTPVINLFKRVSGSFTKIGGDDSISVSTPDDAKIECDGSTIKTYWNGAENSNAQGTDTSLSGTTTAGLGSNNTHASGQHPKVDNYVAADLAAGITPVGAGGGLNLYNLKTYNIKLR